MKRFTKFKNVDSRRTSCKEPNFSNPPRLKDSGIWTFKEPEIVNKNYILKRSTFEVEPIEIGDEYCKCSSPKISKNKNQK